MVGVCSKHGANRIRSNYDITIDLREVECGVCGQWRSFEHCRAHLISETADSLSDFKKGFASPPCSKNVNNQISLRHGVNSV
jgi:hypothetical protein